MSSWSWFNSWWSEYNRANREANRANRESNRANSERNRARRYRDILNKYEENVADENKKAREAQRKAREETYRIRIERWKAKNRRNTNKCDQNSIDEIKKIKLEDIENNKKLEEAIRQEEEANAREERALKLQQESDRKLEEYKRRIDFSEIAEVKVTFKPKPKDEKYIRPVTIECFTNPDKLVDCADESINNIYLNHYEHNIKTYMKNKIQINEMEEKIDNINSRLQEKLNKNINYGPDGEITFY